MKEPVYQTRDVLCRRIDDQGNPLIADDLLCSSNKPKSTQKCQLEPCPAVWATTPWSQVRALVYNFTTVMACQQTLWPSG